MISLGQTRIAIIGAGPAGLVAARWLMAKGFTPTLFEAAMDLGGQWNASNPDSATWPGMRTNTSRIMTAFSDLDHPLGTPIYPTREQMHAYLRFYAHQHDIFSFIRFGHRITALRNAGERGWELSWQTADAEDTQFFERVVIASGRQIAPAIPDIEGLESFSGRLGARHTRDYQGPDAWQGASVLVAGCSISALEIATDLAHAGATVNVAYRRQRYVLPKQIQGVPTEHVMFTRAAALAAERLPPAAVAAGLKAQVLQAGGSPEQWGAQTPNEDIFAAGITQSQGFLPAVSEGRITTRPWMQRIDGRTVHFTDGSSVDVDGILFGTGYRLSLPYLSADSARIAGVAQGSLAAFANTFNPDLPGLAFIGLYELLGPYLPVLELQARWVAECWSNPARMPHAREMAAALADRAGGPANQAGVPMNVMALMYARLLGVEPEPTAWPQLQRALLFGPLSPASFRLIGPDALADAAERSSTAAAAFGRITSGTMTAEEAGLTEALFAEGRAA